MDWSRYTCVDDSAGGLFCSSRTPADATTGSAASGDPSAPAPEIDSHWKDVTASSATWDLPTVAASAFFSDASHSGSTMEMLRSGGLAAVITGALVWIGARVRWLLLPLSALGSMPLTMYAVHVLVIFVLSGPMGSVSSNRMWLVIGAGMTLLAIALAAWRPRGPLEEIAARVSRRTAAGLYGRRPRRGRGPGLRRSGLRRLAARRNDAPDGSGSTCAAQCRSRTV